MAGTTSVLMYHRVLPDARCVNYHLQALAMPLSAFERQIDWLASRFRVLTVDEAASQLASGSASADTTVCLTFDDGYADNYEVVAPILDHHRVRGTFFISSGFTDTLQLPWFDHAAKAWLGAIKSDRDRGIRDFLRTTGAGATVPRSLQEWMLLLKSLTVQLRDELLARLPSVAPAAGQPSDRMMNSGELRSLCERGHEIACHTVSHPIMTMLDDERLVCELQKSRRDLRDWTGSDVPGFSYPNGALDDRVVQAVRDAGFRYACTTERGRNTTTSDLLRLRRIDVNAARVTDNGRHDELAFQAEVSLTSLLPYQRPEEIKPQGVVAYLNSQYPALSHTFIEREIRAVRDRGRSIRTFSVRRPDAALIESPFAAGVAEETFYLLNGAGPVLISTIGAAAVSPAGFARAILAACRISPPGTKARLLHLVYAGEAARLARELRRQSIKHIHVHMANNAAAVAILACEYDRSLAYSLSIHGSAEFFHVDTWNLAIKAERADFVRCISNFCKAQVMAWTSPSAWHKYHVVHCGIDPDVFTPRPPRSPGPLRLLTVGRLHSIKGYDLLLDACRMLADQGVEFELNMVGDGPLASRLKQRAEELRLAGRVRFSGPVDQALIQTHYDGADAMVVSSFMEGVPVVLMEAMAKQMGVVATRVGGVAELVEHGVSGFLVDPGSATALAAGIRRYADDLELCRAHGVAGRTCVLKGYHVDKTGEGMMSLFDRYCRIRANRDEPSPDTIIDANSRVGS